MLMTVLRPNLFAVNWTDSSKIILLLQELQNVQTFCLNLVHFSLPSVPVAVFDKILIANSGNCEIIGSLDS